jgi:ABC-type protease/lipase transport system fused ATPase/permease subunit
LSTKNRFGIEFVEVLADFLVFFFFEKVQREATLTIEKKIDEEKKHEAEIQAEQRNNETILRMTLEEETQLRKQWLQDHHYISNDNSVNESEDKSVRFWFCLDWVLILCFAGSSSWS